VHALTESVADELMDRSIRVNAVLPTILDTPANRRVQLRQTAQEAQVQNALRSRRGALEIKARHFYR
jgi:NAD(P)-dependent dehydrogenase (short-subunit alcohol dehydrogenase family)